MSRVQCLECGIAVVVDPTGVCPEGHLVGHAGVRVASAMGSATAHPDEPEPWVATVVLEDAVATPVARQRAIRPVPVAGADIHHASDEIADHESMMRELHALGEIQTTEPVSPFVRPQLDPVPPRPSQTLGGTPTAPDPQPVAQPAAARPAAEEPAVVQPDADGSRASAPTREQVVHGLAELSALEAAFHALGYDEDGTIRPPEGGTVSPPAATPPAPTPPVQAVPPVSATPPVHAAAPPVHAAAPPAPPAAVPPAPAAPVGGEPELTTDYEDLFGTPSPAPPSYTPAPLPNATQPMAPVAAAPVHAEPHAAHRPLAGGPVHAEPHAPHPAVATPPVAPAPFTPPPAPPGPVDEPIDGAADPAGDTTLDITNFTARGGKVGNGKRKLFGR